MAAASRERPAGAPSGHALPGWRRRLNDWLDRWLFKVQAAEPGEIVLRQRRVFIVPTRAGLGCAAMLVVLFIGALNYNLNLGYALTFLLAACALVGIHLTFRNLAYLSLTAAPGAPVFAGQEAQFELNLINRTGLDRYALWVGFFERQHAQRWPQQAIDVAAHASETISLFVAAPVRGWLAAPRVRLQTRFPLGMLRAWSYWVPAARVLVYPQPEEQAPPLPLGALGGPDLHGMAGAEDVGGVRPYQAGDALRQLAWRQIARLDLQDGGQLLTKYFDGGAARELVLDLAALPPALGLEQKLSRLTRWVIEAEQGGLPYRFTLGATQLPAALGLAHQQQCLRALALFEPEHGA